MKKHIKKLLSRIRETISEEKLTNPMPADYDDDTFHKFITPVKERIKQAFSTKLQKNTTEKETDDGNEFTNDDEDFTIDFTAMKELFKKHSTLIFLALILIMQFIPNQGYLPWGGVWMRLQTQNLPLLDDFAQNSVYNFYRNQVGNQVAQQYPTLPDEQKNSLIDEQLQKTIRENQAVVDEQTRQTAEYLKDFMRYEENGIKYTMMPDIDPYQFLRLARNYVDHGSFGDELRNDVWWDTKILAPLGQASYPINNELHQYVLAYFHKIITFFKPTLPIMQTASYFPIVFVTLAIAFAFLFVRKISNNVGGLVAATFLAIATAAVGRTQWGHADTDAYNLFFPMLISWLFAKTLETNNKRDKYIPPIIAGFFIGIYAVTWAGWWYIFNFILAALTVRTIYTAFFNKNKFRESIITTGIYFVSSSIFVDIFKRTPLHLIKTVLLVPFDFRVIKNAVESTKADYMHLFPNVYTTVAELNPTSLSGAINSIGGMLILAVCIIGLILLFFNKTIIRRNRIAYATFLTLWVTATLYATTKGIRFAILTVPATATLFGICAGLFEQKIQEYNQKKLKLKSVIITIAVILTFAFIIIQTGQVEQSYVQSKNDLPIMNKAWWNTLTAIKEDSKPNAIINSWWDFGHHFKYVADRAVTFDGAHQTSPMAHWIGRVLSTDDEEEAIAVLRMLDCGSIMGHKTLFHQLNDDVIKTINLFKQLIMINNKEDARRFLQKNNISDPDVLLKYTHCNPPENYFITSEDMVQKAGVWSHFGLWNFEKAYLWMYLKNKDKNRAINEMKEKFNYTQERAEQTYFELISIKEEGEANGWISPWPGYISGFDGCNEQNEMILCSNGAFVNKTTNDAFVRVEQGIARPRFLSYIDKKTKEFRTKEFTNSPAGIALILVPTGEKTYRSVLASPEHAKSMFTRLFFMEGHGLKYFKHFRTENQIVGGGKITVWKIDWEGKETNVIESLKKS